MQDNKLTSCTLYFWSHKDFFDLQKFNFVKQYDLIWGEGMDEALKKVQLSRPCGVRIGSAVCA